MQPDSEQVEKGIKEQIKEYRKLQAISDSDEFRDFFDSQIKTVANKLIWGLGTKTDQQTKKTTDNIDNWNDFCKWRGEIIARLQPMQEVYSAEDMIKYLEQQLDLYYRKKVA